MLSSLSKLLSLCSKDDLRQLKKLLVLTLIVGLLEIAGIASIIPFLQLASDPQSIEGNSFITSVFNYFGIIEHKYKLIFIGWFVLLFFTVANFASAISGWIIQKLGWHLNHTISTRIANTYLHTPFEFFMHKEIADVVKSTISDVNNLVNHVLIAGCNFFTSLFVTLTIIALLTIIQPTVAAVTFLLLTSAFLVSFALRKSYISNLGKLQLLQNSQRYITFVDLLNGISTIQSSNSQKYFFNRFENPSLNYASIQPKLFLGSTLPRYVIETLMFGTIVLVVVVLASGGNKFNEYIPTITLYALASYRLLPSINRAYVSAILIASHYHAIDNIYADFDVYESSTERNKEKIDFHQSIKFNNVSYKYPTGSELSLQNISFTIEKGQHTAIVGTSGSGKTTAGRIIVGLLAPSDGQFYVDGIARNRAHTDSWVEKIGYVPQDVFLFNGTVEENICFGLPLDVEKLVHASTIANAHTFITESLSGQYKSIVGDSGIRLSGGQKQRIGLARAIYKSPKILILDEATSALDTKTEKRILEAIYEELKDTTLVVIAHRISTVRNCDKLLLLDGGELAAEGSFDELLSESKLFRELCSYV